MKFSVLMSLYNKENSQYFESAIKSVFEQSVIPNEVVVVHDGPLTEQLYMVIDSWRTKLNIVDVVIEKNVGLGRALNQGLQACKYDLVARVDTDDINVRSRFSLQLAAFDRLPNLAICGGNIEEVDGETLEHISYRVVKSGHENIKKACIKKNPFNHMTVMFRKDAVLKVGGYKHMTFMEDWYLWLRLIGRGYICENIPRTLVKARTGLSMMERRSGLSYITYEFNIMKIKIKIFPSRSLESIAVFFLRSFPRVLPKKTLLTVYKISRRFH